LKKQKHKLDLNDKIESYKKIYKRAKENNEKLKVEGENQYIYILEIKGLNLKQMKL